MNNEEAIKKIKELFLNESIKLHRDKDIIALYDEIIKIAKEADLEAYKLCFEGHKAYKQYNEKAITYLKESIKLDDQISYSWYCLGNVHSGQKENDKAIECYEKANKIDNNFTFPLIGLGNAYLRKQEYDKAIDYFNKVINLDDTLSFYSWYNLGSVYMRKTEYDKAIDYFNKAIESEKEQKDKFAVAYYCLGLIYKEQEMYDQAIKFFSEAKDINEKNGDGYEVLRTKKLIEITNNLKVSSESVTIIAENGNPIGKILQNTKPIFKQSEKNKKDFLDFLIENQNSQYDCDYYLEVLRRWNSYTPIVANDYHISKGGGYFIKAGGCGIVIDPGFNFIDNFKGAGHKFYEIDVVIISHAHNDHTADLESILTLLYKYNDNIKKSDDPTADSIYSELLEEQYTPKNGKKSSKKDVKEMSKKEIDERFYKSGRRKTIDIFMPQSVFKKYGGLFELFERADYRTRIIEKDRKDIKLHSGCNLKMDILGAKHFDIISDYSSVGMVLYTEKSAIVYTGDTGWSAEIEKEYEKASKKIKDKNLKSVLIAHLGGFKEYENMYAKFVLAKKLSKKDSSKIEDSYYKNHLGRIGVAKVAETVKPELCLISEFGEEFKELRQEIAELYDKAFKDKHDIKFLPADIGLVYHFEDSTDKKKNKIKAIAKIDIDNYKTQLAKDNYEFAFVDKEVIKTILLREDYSLHYYAEGLVKPEELIQILQKEYRDSIK